MISAPDRRQAVLLIDEARGAGARLLPACNVLNLSVRTYQRWTAEGQVREDARPQASRPPPPNKLSQAEREEILEIANAQRFRDMAPSQIVPALADEGRYVGSESSFYRVLRDARQLSHRGRSKPPSRPAKPQAFVAAGPNEVWSWDITFLASSVAGIFFRLYMMLDLYSRKIVAWEVHHDESSEHASRLIEKACLAERIRADQLVLHADNGSPMKGATMLRTLQRLGVMPSFSRPSVSDDNPFSEALFRTLKYVPSYPDGPFKDIYEARAWVHRFVQWYNDHHRHSAIRFVTPTQRHLGLEADILARRHAVYLAARDRNPSRWSGDTRKWSPAPAVHLNPDKEATQDAASLEEAA